MKNFKKLGKILSELRSESCSLVEYCKGHASMLEMSSNTGYRIMGRYREVEEIDQADTKEEAEALKSEYIVAFGSGWEIWIEER